MPDNLKPNPKSTFEGVELTDEQIDILELVKTGKNLKVNAFAGTGKSFLLRAISCLALSEKKGLYVAFNKAIVTEATESFPSHVMCKTSHSIAYASVGKKYNKSGRMKGILNGSYLAKNFFDTKSLILNMKPVDFCSIALSAIKSFCLTSDEELDNHHIDLSQLKFVDEPLKAECLESLLYFSQSIWQEFLDPESSILITHDIYFKIWALTKPKLKYDFILVDEAQDQNKVLIDVLQNQQKCQIIWVGDKYQQIYQWRGATNALDIVTTECTSQLTESFRFGDPIAALASKVLNTHFDCDIKIKGNSSNLSAISSEFQPDIIICRTNLVVVSEAIYHTNNNLKVHVIGGVGELNTLLQAAENLLNGRKTHHPDLIEYDNWEEVRKSSKKENGKHLSLLISLVDKYTIPYLLILLSEISLIDEYKADIIMSNVHKSKGRQWDIVKISNDFKEKNHNYYSEEDGNLLYVAVTRAKVVVDISECAALSDFWA